jgi:peroxiredoxin
MTRRTSLIAVSTWIAPALLALGVVLAADAAETPRVGALAPAFQLADEEGVVHDLTSYRGKTVVLEWTNPGCPYVKRHYRADTMEKLAARYDSEVVWLAVNSTWSNKPEDSKAWKQEQGFAYATLQDADGTVGRLYGATTTPDMFVIDPSGMLQYAGAIDDDPRGQKESPDNYVDGAIGSLLAGGAPDPSKTKPYGCSVKYE